MSETVVHLFAYRAGTHRASAEAALGAVWRGARERWAIAGPAAEGVPHDWPTDLEGPSGVRASARSAAGDALSVRCVDDVAILSMSVATPGGRGQGDDPVATLLPSRRGATFGAVVVRPSGGGPRTENDVVLRAAEVWLREEGPLDDVRANRTLVGGAATPEAWRASVWGDDDTLSPLVRYLLLAARLRHELSVWDGGKRLRAAIAEADTAVGALNEVLVREGGPTDEELAGDERRVAAAQVRRAGLVSTATRLEQIRRLADSAHAHLLALIPSTRGFVADDTGLADWFGLQLADDAATLAAVRVRAQEVDTLAAAAVQRRLLATQERARAGAEAADRRRERITLLQAGVVGALVFALTAIQSIGLRFDTVPEPVKYTLVAALTALTLWLSMLAVLLTLREGRGPVAAVVAASALLGGSLAALAGAVAMQGRPDPGVLAGLALGGAVVGGVLAVSVVRVRVRGRRVRRSAGH
jgi:hypothetical protein